MPSKPKGSNIRSTDGNFPHCTRLMPHSLTDGLYATVAGGHVVPVEVEDGHAVPVMAMGSSTIFRPMMRWGL